MTEEPSTPPTPPPVPPSRPATELSALTRWGEPDAAMAAVAARRRQEQQALHALGRPAGDDPVVRLVLASGRWPAYVQHDAGQLRTAIQTLRGYVAEQWQRLATDVDHVRRLDLVMDATVRNLDRAVAGCNGPEASALTSAWHRCRRGLGELPTKEVEAAASAPGEPPQRVASERWRGQKAIVASYDKYVSCAPDVEGRLGIVASRLGTQVIDALNEVNSLRVAANQAYDNTAPVAEMRRHGDNVLAWNIERFTAFERTDLTIEGSIPEISPVTAHRPSDAIARLSRLAQNPPQGHLPGLGL